MASMVSRGIFDVPQFLVKRERVAGQKIVVVIPHKLIKCSYIPGDLLSFLNEFLSDIKIYPAHSYGLISIPKVLSDLVESVLGAVFIDSNDSYDTVWQVFTKLSPSLITLDQLGRHPSSELQALCHSLHRGDAKYDDSDWSKTFTIDVLIDKKVVGSATYPLKKCICRNRAGKAALDNLKGLINSSQVESFFGASI